MTNEGKHPYNRVACSAGNSMHVTPDPNWRPLMSRIVVVAILAAGWFSLPAFALYQYKFDLMSEIKNHGCVAASLLFGDKGYVPGGARFQQDVSMLAASPCRYLHGSIQTYNRPPIWDDIVARKGVVDASTSKTYVYSMAIAENVDTGAKYTDPTTGHTFDFLSMCPTPPASGLETCTPSFARPEYQDYVVSIVTKALEEGVQDFVFGQPFLTGLETHLGQPNNVLDRIAAAARNSGRVYVLGAQTNSNSNPDFLQKFDYIMGGLGITADGSIDQSDANSHCALSVPEFCYALLWDPFYVALANNVVISLDWASFPTDEMHRFARMSRKDRQDLIYTEFTRMRGIGGSGKVSLLLPYRAVIQTTHGDECRDIDSDYYTPSMDGNCRDENAFALVLNGGTPSSNSANDRAERVLQEVPRSMVAGKAYTVSFTLRNTGTNNWLSTYSLMQQGTALLNQTGNSVGSVPVAPQEAKTFHIALTAPTATGPYQFNWQMTSPSGPFDEATRSIAVSVNAFRSNDQDFNGDGTSDLLMRNCKTGLVTRQLVRNTLEITSDMAAYNEPDTRWKVVADGDYNRDGYADLLYRNFGTPGKDGQLFIAAMGPGGLLDMGRSGFVDKTEANTDWKIMTNIDLDSGGKAGFLWWNKGTGALWATLIGQRIDEPPPGKYLIDSEFGTGYVPAGWNVVGSGDFAGTGKRNQLVLHNPTTGEAKIATINGPSPLDVPVSATLFHTATTSWKIVAVGDFNGDGKSDILWRDESTGNETSGRFWMMFMDGTTKINEGFMYDLNGAYLETDLAWQIISTGDYSGDGKADLAWWNKDTGSVYVMAMNGMQILQQGFIFKEPNTHWVLLGPTRYRDTLMDLLPGDCPE